MKSYLKQATMQPTFCNGANGMENVKPFYWLLLKLLTRACYDSYN